MGRWGKERREGEDSVLPLIDGGEAPWQPESTMQGGGSALHVVDGRGSVSRINGGALAYDMRRVAGGARGCRACRTGVCLLRTSNREARAGGQSWKVRQ
jgi:hypothetical protein